MGRRLFAPGIVTILLGCTPPLDPPWLITRPTELALDVEVTGQGPYGVRIVDGPRTPRDALPLDTLSLTPIIVDAEGPLDLDELEGAWMLCGGLGNCLFRGDEVAERVECVGDEIQPTTPCRFDAGGRATLTLADFPDEPLPEDLSSVFDLLAGPTVALVASPPGGPGLDACLARLDARERLDGCVLMERALGLGPLGDLVDLLTAMGIDPGIGPEGDTLLARPRNRNPAVEEIVVRYGTETRTVAAGSRITVPADLEIELSVVPTDDDLDTFEVDVEGELVTFNDPLSAQWWLDAEVDRADDVPGELSVRWHPNGVTEVRAYVVLRDGYGGEAVGWLDLEPAG